MSSAQVIYVTVGLGCFIAGCLFTFVIYRGIYHERNRLSVAETRKEMQNQQMATMGGAQRVHDKIVAHLKEDIESKSAKILNLEEKVADLEHRVFRYKDQPRAHGKFVKPA